MTMMMMKKKRGTWKRTKVSKFIRIRFHSKGHGGSERM
jgi:hypothetical protein